MNARIASVCVILVFTIMYDVAAKDRSTSAHDMHGRSRHLEQKLEVVMAALRSEDYFRLYSYVSPGVVKDVKSLIRQPRDTLWGARVDLREIVFRSSDHRYGIAVAVFEEAMRALSIEEDSWLNVLQRIDITDIGVAEYDVIKHRDNHALVSASRKNHVVTFAFVKLEGNVYLDNIEVDEMSWREAE